MNKVLINSKYLILFRKCNVEREMININANLIKEAVLTSFFKDRKESQVVNFTLAKGYGKGKEYINCAVYGDKVDLAKTLAKGDFVHIYRYFNHRMKDGKTYKNFIVQSLNKIEKKEN